MKTRDIREMLTRHGYERGAAMVMETLNEEIKQTRRDLNELALLFNKMIDTMNGMTAVSERMKEHIDKFYSREQANPELGPNTQSLGSDKKQ